MSAHRDENILIENEVLEFPCRVPTFARMGKFKGAGTLIATSMLSLTTVVGILFVLSMSNMANKSLFIMIALGIESIVMLVIFYFARKMWIQMANQEKDIKAGKISTSIRVTESEISFPPYLGFNRAIKKSPHNRGHEYLFRISEILDFENFPGSKNSPPQFHVSVKSPSGKEITYYLRNPLQKHEIKKLFNILHLRSGLSDEKSPFSEKAEEIRKKKSLALFSTIMAGSFGMVGFFVLHMVFPPVHYYSAVVTLLSYGFALAVPLSLMLKESTFSEAFKEGFGLEMPFWILLCGVTSLSAVVVSLINLTFVGEGPIFETEVTGKKAIRGKNSVRYHLYFETSEKMGSYVYYFKESSSIKVSQSLYSRMKVREGKIKAHVKQGTLGIPIIFNYELLNLSEHPVDRKKRNTKSQKRKSVKFKSKRRQAIEKWRANFPIFPKADEFKIVKYQDGRIRSKEPIVDGQMHGIAEYFHPNGEVYAKITWVNGQKHGRHKLYRDNGTLEQHLSYKNGAMHGVSFWYDQAGKLKSKATFDEGKPIR